MKSDAPIYIAGHTGLVGSALIRCLKRHGYTRLITRTEQDLDLRNQNGVDHFFNKERPEYVFLAAARVGGIKANNDFPALFIYDNLMIQTNIIHSAAQYGVKKLIFLGSSCIYPRHCPQPICEEYLMDSPLEKTNEYYAIAKISGLKMCEAYNKQYGTCFITAMPTNLYGPYDRFDQIWSHVIPALIIKFISAKNEKKSTVQIWGTGNARREFLHVDDLAEALLFLMLKSSTEQMINIGYGIDYSINEIGEMIRTITAFDGTISYDINQPEGTPVKILESSKIRSLGWAPKIDFFQGLKQTIEWYLCNLRKHDE